MNLQRNGLTQQCASAILGVSGPRVAQLLREGHLARLQDGTICPISTRERALAMAAMRVETTSAIDSMLFARFSGGELPDELVVTLGREGAPLSADTITRVWDRYCAMRTDPRVVEARKARTAEENARAAVAAARADRLASNTEEPT